MPALPSDIRALSDERVLAVVWEDHKADFPFKFLRSQCACAQCVNEWTGERILDPESIPEDIAIENMELVGSYALRIHWSDQHNSGLFTWEKLQELSQGI